MTVAGRSSPGLQVHVLGSGSGLPTATRDTTSLLVQSPAGWTLVDVPGSIVHKLARLGLRPDELARVIVTHNHVDHIYGLPHLVHALAIGGGGGDLRLHAPRETLATVAAMVTAHGLGGEGYPRVDARPIDMLEGIELDAEGGLTITASPTEHGRDTVALRFALEGAAFCHSSDTRPSDAVARLARGCELLLHDCAGPHRLRAAFAANHSSALEAAGVAQAAGVARLVLIHLGPADEAILAELRDEAQHAFEGPVGLAIDGEVFRIGEDGDGDG